MDDLLDLDFSAAPPTATRPGAGEGAKGGSSYSSGKSTFDYLAQARTASPAIPSRSTSPLPPPTTYSPALVPPTRAPPSRSSSGTASGAGSDAFASLFGASPAANPAGLSMADRLARDTSNGHSALSGVGLSSNSGSRAASPAVPSRASSINATASQAAAKAWDFDLLTPAPAPAAHRSNVASPSSSSSLFDLSFDEPLPPSSNLSSSSRPPPRATPSTSFNFLDDDDIPSPSSLPPSSGPIQLPPDDEDDEFDILGDLSKPVSAGAPPPRSAASSPAPRRHAPGPSPSPSPPPHVLGQIVEMGFSIDQAKIALVATTTPAGEWNVEGALDVLVEESQVEQQRAREEDSAAGGGGSDDDGISQGRRFNYDDDEDDTPPPRRRPTAAPPSSAPTPRSRQPPTSTPTEDPLPPRPQQAPPTGRRAREAAALTRARGAEDRSGAAGINVHDQAAELLAQASKIGFSVFKSANAYWETGRATIQKALDEKKVADDGAAAAEDGGARGGGKERERDVSGARGGGETPPVAKGRPKWMTDDVVPDHDADEITQAATPSPRSVEGKQRREPTPPLFQDSDEETPDSVLPQRPSARPTPEPRRAKQHPDPPRQAPPPPSAPSSSALPTEYRSPWRHPKSAAGSFSDGPPSRPPSAPIPTPRPRQAPPPRAPTPKPPPRPSVPATPSQLSTSASHRLSGNEFFKLGRFGDADHAYGLAIAALPPPHLLLVPLYNNRASARLKVGDEKGAAEDATQVVSLILGPKGIEGGRIDVAALEAEELPVEVKEVNLRDQLAKALGKRAKANEVNERWEKAMEDWSVVLGAGEAFARSAGGSKVVSESLARCRKMVSGGGAPPSPSSSSSSTAPPRPTATPRPPAPAAKPRAPVQGSGDAVRALRTAASSAAAEDDERLALKDAVDAKIAAWKGGKEANVRALIASLDGVLWPELGWKTVGMHELISEGQVKVRYVRAIAKLHPDKLSVGNTTVEQRMIGGSVFAALNEAWNASK